jgi:hypothetical protein
VLHLQENQLAGDFVTKRLETLIRLEDLDLSNNQLKGIILATISNIPLWNQLSLGHNNLSGEIPDALGNLSLVLRIDLSVNNLTGAIPDSVGRLLLLQELNVSLNELHGGIPNFRCRLLCFRLWLFWTPRGITSVDFSLVSVASRA